MEFREFLQSEHWRKFQESVGRKTYSIGGDDFIASIIEHSLPIVGRYFYMPRGPIYHLERSEAKSKDLKNKLDSSDSLGMTELLNLAKENNAGWIRIDSESEKILEDIKNVVGNAHARSENRNAYMRSLQKYKILKAPHDMQPREILVMDITKPEEELLAGMKQKTRYNIRLAEKKNINVISDQSSVIKNKYIDEFIKLVKITAERDGITSHPESYYRKMFEVIPSDIIKLYVAEYEGKVLAANIMIFYGNTCTYLHGASSDEHRELMAPYLLQWRAIQDAKKAGCEKYDFGGVKTYCIEHKTGNKNNWSGITRFKTGFTPKSEPTIFPGSYDIVINPAKYYLYIFLQKFRGVIS